MVAIGATVSVRVGSSVGVSGEVGVFSLVGELVVVSLGFTVGWIVTDGSEVRVGTRDGFAVVCPQAVRKTSRMQIKKKQRCMSKLYP